MIEVESTDKNVSISIEGNITELCADTVCILTAIRDAIAEKSQIHGMLFELAMRDHLIKLAFDNSEKEDSDSDMDAINKAAETIMKAGMPS